MGSLESDMTERLHFRFSLSCIGEGNGNPLQCSCLENPRDGGAWWAAVYGVAQSRTRLKWLSSSSSSSSSEHVQKVALLCWPGRNKTDVSSQHPPKERKKNGGYQHPDWPPRIKRSREVCSKLSRDRRKQIHHLICNHLNMTFSNHFLSYFSSNTQKIYTIIGH